MVPAEPARQGREPQAGKPVEEVERQPGAIRHRSAPARTRPQDRRDGPAGLPEQPVQEAVEGRQPAVAQQAAVRRGEPFGTICVLDRKQDEHALLFREGLQAFASVIEAHHCSLVESV